MSRAMIPTRSWGLTDPDEESFSPNRPASGHTGYRGRESTPTEGVFRQRFGKASYQAPDGGRYSASADAQTAAALAAIVTTLVLWRKKK